MLGSHWLTVASRDRDGSYLWFRHADDSVGNTCNLPHHTPLPSCPPTSSSHPASLISAQSQIKTLISRPGGAADGLRMRRSGSQALIWREQSSAGLVSFSFHREMIRIPPPPLWLYGTALYAQHVTAHHATTHNALQSRWPARFTRELRTLPPLADIQSDFRWYFFRSHNVVWWLHASLDEPFTTSNTYI